MLWLSPGSNSGILRYAMFRLFVGKRRGWRRWIGAFTATLLLCAQLGVAAYACPKLDSATTSAAPAMEGQGHEPCIELDPQNPTVCNEHCKGQSGVQHVELPGVPPAMVSSLIVPVVAVPQALLPAKTADLNLARLTGPSLSILFCVFTT